MNQMDLSSLIDNKPRIKIKNINKAATEIATSLVDMKILFFDNRTPVIKSPLYYLRVSDDDAETLITLILDDEIKLCIPSYQIQEAIRRAKRASELQIDLSKNFFEGQMYVNVLNGVYNIDKQEIVQDSASIREQYKFDYVLSFNYKPGCKLSDAPVFEKFIKTSVGKEQYECLMEVIGYVLSSLTKGRKAFVFYGRGKTGKSTLLNVIESVIPDGLVSHEPFYAMSGERAKSHYLGKRVNISRETSSTKINRNEESFKSLISNEYTTGSEKFEKSKDFIATLSFLFAGNSDLEFSSLDDELLDRLVYIMFSREIKDEDIDLDLEEKLMDEIDVIFSLALDKLKGLIASKYNFKMSEEALNHIAHRRFLIHSAESFLDDMTEICDGATTSSVALYDSYIEFCARNGVKTLGRNKFYERVRNYDAAIKYGRVPNGHDTKNTVHGFINLRLKGKSDPPDGKHRIGNTKEVYEFYHK